MFKVEKCMEVLKEVSGMEVSILGESTVSRLINDQQASVRTKIFRSEHGNNFDIGIIISAITALIGVIDICLKVIERRDKLQSREQVKQEILEELEINSMYKEDLNEKDLSVIDLLLDEEFNK